MRLLHAGLSDGIGRIVAAQPTALRRRPPRGARQQHLPLHRLREDYRGGAARRRACRRWAQAVNGEKLSKAALRTRPAPSPRRGEGWGEGVTIERFPLPDGERESRRAAIG